MTDGQIQDGQEAQEEKREEASASEERLESHWVVRRNPSSFGASSLSRLWRIERMNEKTEINESAVEELFQLAEEKRAATVNSKKFGPAWATIAENTSTPFMLKSIRTSPLFQAYLAISLETMPI